MKKAHVLFLITLASFGMVGCGSGSLPPQANPDDARAALTIALEAWKKGETSESLASREKPIYFNEIRDRPDVRLLQFTIGQEHGFYGQSVRLFVTASFEHSDGTVEEQKMKFLIDTAPAVVIVPG